MTATIGPAGGSVVGPGGAGVVIPPGALGTATAIAIEQTSAGAPPLPAGLTPSGPMFAFTPHGISFAVPVTMTLPFNAASLPAGGTPELYKTNAQNQWERVAGATFGANSVSAPVTGFSFGQVVVPPLTRGDPVREWNFSTFEGRAMKVRELDSGRQEGGVFEKLQRFGGGLQSGRAGGSFLDHEIRSVTGAVIPQDGFADGQVFSSADGVTYGAFAEAPRGGLGTGGRSVLRQFQAFVKRSEDATLSFTLSSAFIDLLDDNGGFGSIATFTDFPGKCVYPAGQVAALDACQDILRGQLILSVTAFTHATGATTPGRTFFHTAGTATALGHTGHYQTDVTSSLVSGTPLWSSNDFETDVSPGGNFFVMTLREPRTYTVDLSSVAVGEEFTLRSDVLAEATNRQGDKFAGGRELDNTAAAFLRDPLSVGGTSLVFSGLDPLATPVLVAPPEVPVPPAPCPAPGGTDPQAGVIQFSAAAYTIEGHGGATQPVRITRTGGSRGAVTATFTTSDGSAVGGTDYTPVNVSVFFADGDTQERLAEIPLIQNQTDGEPDKTVNLRLADPGNCATLGAQSTAVLTLLDNKAPTPPPPSGLDPSFGTGGKVTTEGFGGDETAMALQSDGKIVMVGGSTDAFVLARYNADGSLDPSFGTGGTVTTDLIPGGIVQEVANGVAVQPDGRIVVIGYTRSGLPFTFALARYNADGSPDPSFGTGGEVTGGVGGRAFAVALQTDGKIVVAGDDPVSEDFRLARYNADGSLDASFGSGGVVSTDLASGPDVARNVVVQPDGKVVASGDPFGSGGSTGLARYTAGGALDPGFGAGGRLTLTGAQVGAGLALQPDGKFVLVGSERTSTVTNAARFAVRRLNIDGSPDLGFGTAGSAFTAFTTGRDAAAAVTLQQGGKILVSGTANGTQFALARLNPDGTPDTGFLGTGKTSFRFFPFDANAENVAVQQDGKIVLGGFAQTLSNIGYALARINP